jgi:hypothetical protein
MNIDEASARLAHQPTPRHELETEIELAHAKHPQALANAKAALAAIMDGLKSLAAMGHRFAISNAPEVQEPVEFPKAMYHQDLGTRVVNNSDEESKLGPGWYWHPSGHDPEDKEVETVHDEAAPKHDPELEKTVPDQTSDLVPEVDSSRKPTSEPKKPVTKPLSGSLRADW